MKGFLLIILSAVSEALWNIALKKSGGFTDWSTNAVGILFLVCGILTFKKAIGLMPMSIVIVIWSGLSLMLTIVLDVYLFKTRLDYRVVLFMALCIVSIIGLNYYSQTTTTK